jgi:hypothetical protein
MSTYIVDVCEKCGRAIAAGPVDESNLQLAIFSLTVSAGATMKCATCQGRPEDEKLLRSSIERFRIIVEGDMKAAHTHSVPGARQ